MNPAVCFVSRAFLFFMPAGPWLGHPAKEGTSGEACIQWIPAPELTKLGDAAVVIKNKRITGLVAFVHCRWLHGAQRSVRHLRRSSSAADGKGRFQVLCVPFCSRNGQPCPQTVTRGEVDTGWHGPRVCAQPMGTPTCPL